MEELEIRRGKYKGLYRVYTKDEALAAGITPVPWKQAETGQWALSDDGFVMQVLWHWVSPRNRRMIRTARGTFLDSGLPFTNEPRESATRYTGKDYKSKFYFSEAIKLWAIRVAAGGNPEEVYKQIFGSRNKKYIAEKVRSLLRQQEVIEFMKAELKPIMEKLGITQEFVLQGYLDMYNDGDVNEHVRLKCLNEMAVLTGVKDNEERPAGDGFIGFGDITEITEGRSGTRAALPAPDEDQPALEDMEEKHA